MPMLNRAVAPAGSGNQAEESPWVGRHAGVALKGLFDGFAHGGWNRVKPDP
jgi:hypothetical protein